MRYRRVRHTLSHTAGSAVRGRRSPLHSGDWARGEARPHSAHTDAISAKSVMRAVRWVGLLPLFLEEFEHKVGDFRYHCRTLSDQIVSCVDPHERCVVAYSPLKVKQ
jgi:hypothetical protein